MRSDSPLGEIGLPLGEIRLPLGKWSRALAQCSLLCVRRPESTVGTCTCWVLLVLVCRPGTESSVFCTVHGGHSLSGRASELIVPQVGVGFYVVARVRTLLTAWPNVGTQFRSGVGTSQMLAVLC